MSKLCRISIVGLYLVLLTHIAHSFVLLTANIDDVKKIARKFVSDSLAERITNFLAKATENLTLAEENKDQDSSQVSAENRLYNVEKTINDRLDNIRKKEEESTGTPRSMNMENEKHKEVEYKTPVRSKHRNTKPKIVHSRSRYIEPVEQDKSTENNDKNIEKKDISSNPSAPEAKKINKTKNRFKLPSAFDANTTTTGIPTVADKAKIDKNPEKKADQKSSETVMRSIGEEIATRRESDLYYTDKEYGTEKAVNEFDQYETGNNKNTEKPANNYDQYNIQRNKNTETEGASAPMSEKDEFDNNIIPTDEKVINRGSLVKEKDFNDDKWWEKELTTRIQYDADVQAEGKSWF